MRNNEDFVQVARLSAIGLTDAQIAAALCMRPKTLARLQRVNPVLRSYIKAGRTASSAFKVCSVVDNFIKLTFQMPEQLELKPEAA